MLSVVTWFWGRRYSVRHVNVLRSMLERHLHIKHRLFVFSDRALDGLDARVTRLKLWRDYSGPGCWKRLKAFSREMQGVLGSRYLSLDLDLVIVDDITPMVDRREPLVIARAARPGYDGGYSGTMWLCDTGAYHRSIWMPLVDCGMSRHTLDRLKSKMMAEGYNGTDSAWISHCLGAGVPVWQPPELRSIWWDFAERGVREIPKGTRIVLFHGRANDPDSLVMQDRYPWIKEHWC